MSDDNNPKLTTAPAVLPSPTESRVLVVGHGRNLSELARMALAGRARHGASVVVDPKTGRDLMPPVPTIEDLVATGQARIVKHTPRTPPPRLGPSETKNQRKRRRRKARR